MHKYLVDLLCCPVCQGNLEWKTDGTARDEFIESGTAKCPACKTKYPVKNGIGIFVKRGEQDPWKDAYRDLGRFIKTRQGREFLALSPEELNPTDRFILSYMLEIQEQFQSAQKAKDSAMTDMYTEEYRNCLHSQIQYIVKSLSAQPRDRPIVDLASGRGVLAEQIIDATSAPVVMTDISPIILERDKKIFDEKYAEASIDYLAFDLRHMPFKSSSVTAMTTNLGLQNISEKLGQVDSILTEIKRIDSGKFFGVSNFFDPEDSKNGAKISEIGLEWSFYKENFLGRFRSNGFGIEVENVCSGRSEPTPSGYYFKEVVIDSLPVESAKTEWCTVVASNNYV